MDDDVDMAGGGELKAPRTLASNYQVQDQEPLLDRSARPGTHQDSSSIEYSTLTDSNNTGYITDSTSGYDSSQNKIPRSIPNKSLSPRDPAITFSCPAGTLRFEIDFELQNIDGTPTGVHKPCARSSTVDNLAMGSTGKSSPTAPSAGGAVTSTKRVNPEQLVARLLGTEATSGDRMKLKHFTSTFRCDGHCTGSTKIDDYLLCEKCCAWQHKDCMLHRAGRGVDGPICNRCFMTSFARRGSTAGWQRKRLVKAVQEAWKFLKDPANRHQVVQRAQARRFFAAFFLKNEASLLKFVARKKADQTAAGLSPPDHDGDTHMDVDDDERHPSISSLVSVSRTSPSAATGDGLDDLEELGRRLSGQYEGRAATHDSHTTPAPLSSKSTAHKKAAYQKAEIRAALSTMMQGHNQAPPRLKPVPSQQYLVIPAQARLKPAPPRSKPALSSQSADAMKRKRSFSPDDESMMLSADSKLSRYSAPRKSAPGLLPRDSARSFKGPKHVRFDDRNLDDQTTTPRGKVDSPTSLPYDKVACKCSSTTKPTQTDCFKCIECGTSQHKGCRDDNSDDRPALCNFCINSTVATKRSIDAEVAFTPPKSPEEREAATKLAKATRSVQINGIDEYVDSFRQAVKQESHALCSTVLWKEWCNIPYSGQALISQPEYPAEPLEEWLKEAKCRLEKLLSAAGRNMALRYLQPVLKMWPRDHHQVMVAMRDLTLEVVHCGAYRGKGGDLGLLAEVIGLEMKGRMWKGAVV